MTIETLININKWNDFLNLHSQGFFTVLGVIGIIAFFINFIMTEIGDEKMSLGWNFLVSFSVGFITLIASAIIIALSGISILLVCLFGICLLVSKVIRYIKNKQKDTYQISSNRLEEIVDEVYKEMKKFNPEIEYDFVKNSVAKNIK